MKLKDMKIGQSIVVSGVEGDELIETDAITFEEYKKLHPKTSKKVNDPMFLPSKKRMEKGLNKYMKKHPKVEKHLNDDQALHDNLQ